MSKILFKKMTILFCAAILCLCSSVLKAQTHQVMRISPAGLMNPGETAIAINPIDVNNIVAVTIGSGFKGQSGSYIFYTNDCGKIWDMSVNGKNIVWEKGGFGYPAKAYRY